MGSYLVRCVGYEKDEDGKVTEILCTADLETGNGNPADGRKVKGTLHWVSSDSVKCEVRLYDRLFSVENPGESENYLECLNPGSLEILTDCLLEGDLAGTKPGDTYQFMRQGYFCVDKLSDENRLVFNRTVALNSSWK